MTSFEAPLISVKSVDFLTIYGLQLKSCTTTWIILLKVNIKQLITLDVIWLLPWIQATDHCCHPKSQKSLQSTALQYLLQAYCEFYLKLEPQTGRLLAASSAELQTPISNQTGSSHDDNTVAADHTQQHVAAAASQHGQNCVMATSERVNVKRNSL